MKYQNIKKNKLRNTNRIPYIHHVILFVLREALFCLTIPLLLFPSIDANTEFYVANDLVFLNAFNVFIFFMTYNSVISQKIFTYYVSILILIDNGIINLIVLKTVLVTLKSRNARLIAYMISISFIFEALISIYLVYINRFLSWMDVFKKLGANTRIRNAYFYRQILLALIPYEFFLTFYQLEYIVFPVSDYYYLLVSLNGVVIILSLLQLVFICVSFNEEDAIQRRVAIIASFLRLAMIWVEVGFFIYYKSTFSPGGFFIILVYSTNYTITSVIILTVLIKDMSLFRSGLKEYLKTVAAQISLS